MVSQRDAVQRMASMTPGMDNNVGMSPTASDQLAGGQEGPDDAIANSRFQSCLKKAAAAVRRGNEAARQQLLLETDGPRSDAALAAESNRRSQTFDGFSGLASPTPAHGYGGGVSGGSGGGSPVKPGIDPRV
jgi:hypothetical protein